MVKIEESGMEFEFEEEDIFHIEKSKIYKRISDGVQIAEFELKRKNNSIWIIEAKSSSPQPSNKDKFDKYISEICSKLVNTISLTVAILINRHTDEQNEISEKLKSLLINGCDIKLILVIKNHKEEWLPSLSDALNQNIIVDKKIWRFELVVINDKIAREKKIIK